jgi:iron complex outermembrane receptor protein
VPRIPPLRVLGGLEAQSDLLTGRLEVEHVWEQDRIAAFETSTDGYTLVNAFDRNQGRSRRTATSR